MRTAIQRAVAGIVLTAAAPALNAPAAAQIARHPTGVNVNAMGVTTVFITYGNVGSRVPVEAMWCGELVPAAPHIGQRCDPGTLFGFLPVRYDISRRSELGFTDIMTIPASVARRAYQAAVAGADSDFFYVRRFVDPAGGPDEYVVVTCRMGDGGARTPFALTDVKVTFTGGDPVTVVPVGARPPAVSASIVYNGTGRLTGRWEIVRPGEEPPRPDDLLPEAALPREQRTRQRRFLELERFDVFLPPVGSVILPGPDPARLPTDAPGEYLLLLRLEATDDKEGDSDLGAALAGTGLVHAGGVAGFAVPPLRYVAGSGFSAGIAAPGFRPMGPTGPIQRGSPASFTWSDHANAALYRIEFAATDGRRVMAALLPAGILHYSAPAWLADRVGGPTLHWRVVALGVGRRVLAETPWTAVAVEGAPR